jgi:phosphoribosylformylglycinamidine cyclo-ligase
MQIYVPEAVAQDIIAISKSFKVDAQIVESSRW